MMRIVLFFSLLVSLSFQQGFACDCKVIPVSEKAIASSEFIFLGKVVAISGCDKTAKASFSVQELFRGKSFANTEIEFDCSSDCQMSFVPGQTWLIYATYKGYGQAEVNFCGYSRLQFANEKDDYNTAVHGMNFTEEENWLKKNLGLQVLNVKNPEVEKLHENIHPNGFQVLWYLGLGFIFLVIAYFVGRKIFK